MSALECLLEFSNIISKAVIFVDSKSFSSALENFNTKGRPDLVFEIYNLLYHIHINNTNIDFCWVPSHCNIYGNEMADRAAKKVLPSPAIIIV
jgi:ribonuclease HI